MRCDDPRRMDHVALEGLSNLLSVNLHQGPQELSLLHERIDRKKSLHLARTQR